MEEKWYQLKEQSAGRKRLLLTYYLYKIFGRSALYSISFLVSLFTFLFSKKIRSYSCKNLKVMGAKSGYIHQFKNILAYANSLSDKILVYLGEYDVKNILFDNEDNEVELFEDIKKNKGVFLICNHIGNIEIMQSLFLNKKTCIENKVNIFLSKKQSQIFNSFLDDIKVKMPVKIYAIDDIDINTGFEIKENLDKGDILFMAGDRISETGGSFIEADFLSEKIYLPKGTFKLAKFVKTPVYFVSAIKVDKKYKIFLEKQKDLNFDKLTTNFAKYLEKMAKINPYQFFNFYDVFH